jgi:hypothetical protein
MSSAIAAINDGLSMRKASMKFNIPYSSLRQWYYDNTRSRERGTRGVLITDEENLLVEYLIEMCNRELGLLPTQLKMKVYEITRNRWIPSNMVFLVVGGCVGGSVAT